jgi:hypothetical protein
MFLPSILVVGIYGYIKIYWEGQYTNAKFFPRIISIFTFIILFVTMVQMESLDDMWAAIDSFMGLKW